MLSTQALLTLLSLPGVGRKTTMQLGSRAQGSPHTAAEFVDFLRSFAQQHHRFQNLDSWVLQEALAKASAIIDLANEQSVKVIGFNDVRYPQRLKNIPDPPPVLFVKGDSEVLNAPVMVALIGTREPSDFGARAAKKLGQRLALNGIAVVSGLALGCDTEAHVGCVGKAGRAVAVMAHGLDKVYPASNRVLAEEILATSGCLVSEYPVGVKPQRTAFVERDRIQSGLSDAVIVVETGLVGGSMHTVRFCELHNRRLACVRHPAEYASHDKAQGNAELINSGRAVPLSSHDDLNDFLTSIVRGRSNSIELTNKADDATSSQQSFEF